MFFPILAHDSNEKSLSEISRKRLLLNLLHALRTLRNHKKVKSTTITFPKFDYAHSNTKHDIGAASNHILSVTKTIDDTRPENQVTKRSKGIHKELTGIKLVNERAPHIHFLYYARRKSTFFKFNDKQSETLSTSINNIQFVCISDYFKCISAIV